MSNREDQEREAILQPLRMETALKELGKLGIEDTAHNDSEITFFWKGYIVHFYPYSGWHTGSSIKDGRGLQKLLKQLK